MVVEVFFSLQSAVRSIHMCIKVQQRSGKISGRTVYYPGVKCWDFIEKTHAVVMAYLESEPRHGKATILTAINAY